MKIAVVGPGAIGMLFATLLKRGGHAVHILDRHRSRAEAITLEGIELEDGACSTLVRVPATTDAMKIGPCDCAIIAVKAHDTAEAMEHAAGAIGPSTTVVSQQNGAGNGEIIASYTGAERVVCASTLQGATRLSQRHIRRAGKGMTLLAGWGHDNRGARSVSRAFMDAQIEAHVVPNAQSLIWSKLAISAGLNPVTALNGVTNGEILRHANLQETAAAAVREAAAVAEAAGITLLYGDPAEQLRMVCTTTSANRSSMLQDFDSGSRTEIEAINGAVVEAARRLGVQTPVNADLLKRVQERSHAQGVS